MMGKKKKLHPILKILVALFIIYIALFIANISGYYETKIREKTTITEEGIKKFEEKINNGEEVSITSFLDDDRKDYSNKFSKLGDSITKGIENLATKGMKIFVQVIKSLF